MFDLRPYQRAAIDALYAYLEAEDGRPLIVLPTGSGKSLVMAELIRDAMTRWPATRILILAHVRELLAQNRDELLEHYPEADVGVYSAGMNSRQTGNRIVVAGIQSVCAKAALLGAFDLILQDECHLVPRNAKSMYQRFYRDSRILNPHVRFIGLTATDFRLDSGRLTEINHKGERTFDKVVYDANIGDLIKQGHLCNLRTYRPETRLDTSGVHVRGGEFIASELERAVDIDQITQAAVKEIVTAGADRRAWLVFCSGVRHSEHVAEALRAHGISTGCVTGDTSKVERDTLIRDFRAGRLRAVSNCQVMTTGMNVPSIDLMAILRPTQSTGLYVQMIGRGSRNAPGKTDCVILDFAGNIERHGPIDAVHVHTPEDQGDGSPLVKACPQCSEYVAVGVRVCPSCEYQFPVPEPKLDPKSSKAAILSDQIVPEWLEVIEVKYRRHEKADKLPSLRVEYQVGFGYSVSEWVCLEHGGFVGEKAAQWWARRVGGPIPRTVDEALEDAHLLRRPSAVQVRPEGRWQRITAYKWRVEQPLEEAPF